jgi:hypothetical protein
MLLLRTNTAHSSEREVWTARTAICADAEDVLRALTDPAAIASWAPVSFEVDGLAGGCLRAGSRERVSGSIAGIRAEFDVEVHVADTDRLELVAVGPVALDVAYSFSEHDGAVLVEAAVAVRRRRGLAAQVLRAAVAALLNAGALAAALRRLDASLFQASPSAARNCLATVAGSC